MLAPDRRELAHPEVSRWARSLKKSGDLAGASVVPYLNDEVAVGESGTSSASHAADPVPERSQPRDDTGDRPRTSRAPAITSASWR